MTFPSTQPGENPDLEFLAMQMAGLANILDHVISQVDTLRGEVRTLTRRLEARSLILADGTVVFLQSKE